MLPPDCWDPPATSSHARKCTHAKKKIRPPDCWDPPSTSSHARKCLTVGTHRMGHCISQKTFPPHCWDPPDGPLYFVKKTFPPECWDPPATSSHARKCFRANKKRFAPLTAGTHQLHLRMQVPDSRDPPGRSVRSVVILVANVYVHTGRCRGAHMS